ncbi:MAG: hypothetical protein GX837_07540 [Methanomicrobiales archaeon]|nr:hypothetical protein [Methanomicrobiales archaeon]
MQRHQRLRWLQPLPRDGVPHRHEVEHLLREPDRTDDDGGEIERLRLEGSPAASP